MGVILKWAINLIVPWAFCCLLCEAQGFTDKKFTGLGSSEGKTLTVTFQPQNGLCSVRDKNGVQYSAWQSEIDQCISRQIESVCFRNIKWPTLLGAAFNLARGGIQDVNLVKFSIMTSSFLGFTEAKEIVFSHLKQRKKKVETRAKESQIHQPAQRAMCSPAFSIPELLLDGRYEPRPLPSPINPERTKNYIQVIFQQVGTTLNPSVMIFQFTSDTLDTKNYEENLNLHSVLLIQNELVINGWVAEDSHNNLSIFSQLFASDKSRHRRSRVDCSVDSRAATMTLQGLSGSI